MKPRSACIVWVVLVAGCQERQAAREKPMYVAPACEARIPLDVQHLLSRLRRFDIEELMVRLPVSSAPPQQAETYTLWSDAIVNDGYVFRVHFNRTTNEIWIHKTGGYAGVSEFRGPVSMAGIESWSPREAASGGQT